MSSSDTTPPFPPPQLLPILKEVTSLLHARNAKLAIAETAAGGLTSASILSTPGASKIYAGGLTLYTLPSRIAYANWTDENIQGYSGPTTTVVSGLASQVRRDLTEADFVLAESGTAGPTGGATRNRRPGYVALAVDCEEGTFVREVETGLGGDRVGNMVAFAEEGLKLVRDVLTGKAKL
jgi:PncC family amidohydrolase